MTKRFPATLDFLGAPLLFAVLAVSIGCSGESPVAPSPAADIRATPNNAAAALEPTTSGATFANAATGLQAPARRVTHDTAVWTFNLLNDASHDEHSNKYRLVEFTTPETGDTGTHWYVQFRSIETYEGEPHERGIFVRAQPGSVTEINGFWANTRYIVRARSYAKAGLSGAFYSIGNSLTEVDRFTTPSCPTGTQPRDQLRSGEPNAENPYRCELIPQPPAPVVSNRPAPGMITPDAAIAWGTANNLNSFALAFKEEFPEHIVRDGLHLPRWEYVSGNVYL